MNCGSRIPHVRSPGARLQRLFDRYNRLYWSGKLSGYRAVPAGLEGCLGQHEKRTQPIMRLQPGASAGDMMKSSLRNWNGSFE